jgi:hypothetical protein
MNTASFPRTPHLFIPPGLDIRDDKVLSPEECAAMLRHSLVVEEKVDGANLGISLDGQGRFEYQNRNHRFSSGGKGQFEKLGEWAYARYEGLHRQLSQRYVLFGEWCYARHSVTYDRLPDYFLGFDVCDRQEGFFLGTRERDLFFREAGVQGVRRIADGRFTRDGLMELLMSARSAYADTPVEGLVIRQDEGGRLTGRAKLVRPDFIQGISTHWSKGRLERNRLAGEG